MRMLVLTLAALAGPASADTVLAARTIRAQEVIGPDDLTLSRGDVPGGFSAAGEVVGQESRVILYAGRPVLRGDVGPPAVVDRNQLVAMVYAGTGLRITAEGRAMDRAAAGDRIRVMNLTSRATVSGLVRADGTVLVTE